MERELYIVSRKRILYLVDAKRIWDYNFKDLKDREKCLEHLRSYDEVRISMVR